MKFAGSSASGSSSRRSLLRTVFGLGLVSLLPKSAKARSQAKGSGRTLSSTTKAWYEIRRENPVTNEAALLADTFMEGVAQEIDDWAEAQGILPGQEDARALAYHLDSLYDTVTLGPLEMTYKWVFDDWGDLVPVCTEVREIEIDQSGQSELVHIYLHTWVM